MMAMATVIGGPSTIRLTAAASTAKRSAPRRVAAVARVTASGAAGRSYHGAKDAASTKRGMSVVAHGKKEDAAKRALMGAFSSKGDVLSENDGGGGIFGGFFGPGRVGTLHHVILQSKHQLMTTASMSV
jgi:hypothetical protein